jgi:brefeldin A-inhibited guanine nucleotide-exchange protein
LHDLFDLILQTGHKYSSTFWSRIFAEILLPLFNDLGENGQLTSKNNEAWVSTTMVLALKSLTDLYTAFPILLEIALAQILDLLVKCILQENDTLSKIGCTRLEEFVINNAGNFKEETWKEVCNRIQGLFEVTKPVELFFKLEGEPVATPFDIPCAEIPAKSSFPKIIVKCVIHLNIINSMLTILSCPTKESILNSLNKSHIFLLGDCLYSSYVFALMFNQNLSLRKALLNIGFMKTLPNLVRQETTAVAAYLILLSKIYSDSSRGELQDEVEKRLIPVMHKLLVEYSCLDPVSQHSGIKAMDPVIQSIVSSFAEFQDHQFAKHIQLFYDPLVHLIKWGNNSLMEHLFAIFIKVGKIYGISKPGDKISPSNMLFPSLSSLDVSSDEVDNLASSLVDESMKRSKESLEKEMYDPFSDK